MLVVDVSYHNGVIDWKRAKDNGVVGAVIRCGYGRNFTKYDDTKFKSNMDGALANGIKVGVYLYSYAKDLESAKSEALHAIRLCAPYKSRLSLPVFFDSEENGTQKVAKQAARIFCETLKAEGYEVGIYANADWFREVLGGNDLAEFVQWIAKWGKVEPTGFANMQLWQYDAYGNIPGIGSGVDLDKPYGKIAEILNGKTPEEDKVMVELKVLKKGVKTDDFEVLTLQSLLKAKGYKGADGKVLALDNSMGKNTCYALGNFQRDNGLVDDEICGSKTWNKLLKG